MSAWVWGITANDFSLVVPPRLLHIDRVTSLPPKKNSRRGGLTGTLLPRSMQQWPHHASLPLPANTTTISTAPPLMYALPPAPLQCPPYSVWPNQLWPTGPGHFSATGSAAPPSGYPPPAGPSTMMYYYYSQPSGVPGGASHGGYLWPGCPPGTATVFQARSAHVGVGATGPPFHSPACPPGSGSGGTEPSQWLQPKVEAGAGAGSGGSHAAAPPVARELAQAPNNWSRPPPSPRLVVGVPGTSSGAGGEPACRNPIAVPQERHNRLADAKDPRNRVTESAECVAARFAEGTAAPGDTSMLIHTVGVASRHDDGGVAPLTAAAENVPPSEPGFHCRYCSYSSRAAASVVVHERRVSKSALPRQFFFVFISK